MVLPWPSEWIQLSRPVDPDIDAELTADVEPSAEIKLDADIEPDALQPSAVCTTKLTAAASRDFNHWASTFSSPHDAKKNAPALKERNDDGASSDQFTSAQVVPAANFLTFSAHNSGPKRSNCHTPGGGVPTSCPRSPNME